MKKRKKLLGIGAWTLLAAVLVVYHAVSGTGNRESLAATSQEGKIQEDLEKPDRTDEKEKGQMEAGNEELAFDFLNQLYFA